MAETIPWPPLGLPPDARVFQLKPNTKEPPPGYKGGYHRAKPVDEALVVVCEKFSYGVSLDDQFLLVDRDADSEQARQAFDALPATWTQETWSGKLHKLYRLPDDFHGKATKWKLANGEIVGDLKPTGYMVGPGSCVNDKLYVLLDDRPPVPAPPELLALVERSTPTPPVEEITRIPVGERDRTMTQIAGFLRRHGWAQNAMSKALWGIARSGVMEQPLGNEWLEKDATRVARSAINWEAEQVLGPLLPAAIISGADVSLVGPPLRWLMHGYVPRGELTLCYGDGGTGKTSWAAWLAAQVTRKGERVLVFCVEESFRRFLLRVALSGGDYKLVYTVASASRLSFPKHTDELKDLVSLMGISMVYFDSVYSHFDPMDRANISERTRRTLGSMAEVAQGGPAVLCIFHENRGGEFSGSAEMKNVPRCLLHAQREENGPMTLLCEKTNFRKPTLVATFVGHDVLAIDPETGRGQQEEQADGTIETMKLTVVERGEDIPMFKKGKGRWQKVKEINLADIEYVPPPSP